MGALPFVAGSTSQPVLNSGQPLARQQGVHPTLRCLAPQGGPDGTPYIGGGVVYSKSAGILLVLLVNVLVII
jgi:hypothetical protein